MEIDPNKLTPTMRKLNPHLFTIPSPALKPSMEFKSGKVMKKPTRIRQDRSLPNKLETKFGNYLRAFYPSYSFRAQSKRYRLANGIWYKPDWVALMVGDSDIGREHCWEVKGPKIWRGGLENLKVAATTFPEIVWHLVQETPTGWDDQIVLP